MVSTRRARDARLACARERSNAGADHVVSAVRFADRAAVPPRQTIVAQIQASSCT
ncbi:MAG: hypothetical protein JWN04_5220 [Myxococcaceae bacterium]|nr:hypothetical protein [Myxococcaceae bacterium]